MEILSMETAVLIIASYSLALIVLWLAVSAFAAQITVLPA